MNIADKIQEIIEQRNQQAKNLESVLNEWYQLKKLLEKIEQERQKHLNDDSSGNSNIARRLQNLNFLTIIEKVKKELQELENLKKRLSRSTLNIGVVGRMRQGKSRLLQSLTGLSDDEIPTSSGGVCTRSLSKIFHESNPTMLRNEIEFHSWSSLKQIIHLYFDKLGLPNSEKPNNLPDDLDPNQLPHLPKQKQGDTDARYQYGRLRKGYYVGSKNYKSLINSSSRQIPKEDIRKYITQIEDNDGNINSEYIATKELRIYCQFPYHQEVGKIGVVDLPGLGDTLFDTELLIETIKGDIDFILFIRRPDPRGDDWQDSDRNMYDIASQALGDFPISQCSFMVLNRITSAQQKNDGLKTCERFQKKINSQKIEVSQTVIADCTDDAQVKSKILGPVLDALTTNTNNIYNQYLLSHNQSLNTLKDEINQELEQAGDALKGYAQGRDKVVSNCEKELKMRLSTPNKEAYTKFNKFIISAFWGEYAQTHWRDFYDINKSILWPDAQQKQEYERVEREWQNLVNSAVDALTSIN